MLGNKLADLVTELALKLEKCAEASSQDAEQVKDILHQLDKIEMTLEVLKISKIGFALKKVKSAEGMSEDTKKLASSLTKKWKGVAAGSVARTATSLSSAASGNSSAAGPLSRPSSAASNKGSDVEAGSRAAAEATATTVSGKTEGAPKQTIANGNVKEEAPAVKKANGPKSVAQFPFGSADDLPPQRAKVRDVFFTSFLKYPEAQQDEQRAARVAIAIEEELHELTDAVLNTAAYGDKVRSLKYNLSANEDLRFRVIVGDVSAADLVVMKPEDMQAEAQRQAAEAARKTEYEARMLDWQEQNEDKLRKRLGIEDVGGSFTCRRCKKNKTAYQAKQTRSSDEPMTMFIRCLNCGNRWKEG